MNTIEQRIKDAMAPYEDAPFRAAILLLAEHVQRHDDLVAAQWRFDRGVDMRRGPDEEMDELPLSIAALRAEIAGMPPEVIEYEQDEERRRMEEVSAKMARPTTVRECIAEEKRREAMEECHIPPLDFKPITFFGSGPGAAERQADNAVYRWTEIVTKHIAEDMNGLMVDALRESGFVPKAELDAAEKRIKELEEKLSHVEYVNELLQDAEKFDHAENDRLAHERDAAKKRIKELEKKTERAECALSRAYCAMSGGRISKPETPYEHIEAIYHSTVLGKIVNLSARLTERDADAEVGKAIRELRPKKGHHAVSFTVTVCDTGRYAHTEWFDDGKVEPRESDWQEDDDCEIDAIREYNERED